MGHQFSGLRLASCVGWRACPLAAIGLLFLLGRLVWSAEPYRIGDGDVLEVVVADAPELSYVAGATGVGGAGLTVDPDGRIGYPYLGLMPVAGKTCEEVAAIIRRGLTNKGLMKDPDVIVRIQRAAQTVAVVGCVARPGPVTYQGDLQLSEAISRSGGITPDAGEPGKAIVSRAAGKIEEFNLQKALAGDQAHDVDLYAGDVVYVPRTLLEVIVAGCVKSPGRYIFRQGDRATDALALAGGATVTSPRPDLAHILLTRSQGEVRALDLSRATSTSQIDEKNNPALQPQDMVLVPELRIQASVLGHVAVPGHYDLQTGDRLSTVLAAAGGPLLPKEAPAHTTGADLAHARLYRASGEVVPVDLRLLYDKSGPFNDLTLENGDVLVVPEGQNRVMVAGYVKTPGYFEFRPGDTVKSAIAMAGGVLPDLGTTSIARVRHADGKDTEIALAHDDPALQPGDEVTVPFASQRVVVLGHVQKPGLYEWHEGDTVVDAIAAAGGLETIQPGGPFRNERGNLYRAILVRRNGQQGEVRKLDLERFYTMGDVSANVPTQIGDVIVIPGKGEFDYQSLLQELVILPRLLGVKF